MASLMDELCDYVRSTDAEYAPLKRDGVVAHPVPFFGAVEAARVVTVGVNPSADEFVGGRWPAAPLPTEDLGERLMRYFDRQPHPWFETWEQALGLLGVSYLDGTAAHLDLSPRATVAFQTFRHDPDHGRRDHFLRMVRDDLPWFCRVLAELCPNVRLVLLAGGVANVYMDDFLGRHLRRGPTRIEFPSGKRKGGKAPVTWPVFHAAGRVVPSFFCGVSPSSSRRSHLLVERVETHKDRLLQALAEG